MTYTQLTQEQRYQIYALLKIEHSQTKIAAILGVHKSTISRELRRNCGQRGYRPKQAQRLSLKRQRDKVLKRITPETWSRINEKLEQDWSPELVSGWLKNNTDVKVRHEWIYQHIYTDKRSGGDLYKHLRCQKKRRKRTGIWKETRS